jgi:hypothetical protein
VAECETESKPDQPPVEVKCDCEVDVTLPEWVRNDLRMVRWLHHRVVDLLADHGHTAWMIQDVEDRLGALSGDLIDDAITELVAEASTQPLSET